MTMFTDIKKGMPNGAEAIQENFKALGNGIKEVTGNGTVRVRTLEADKLVVPTGLFEKVGTFKAGGAQFKNEIEGEIYKSGNMYVYNFKGMQFDVKTPIAAGSAYTIDIKIDGDMPSLSPWVAGSGATNATQASIEATLMTSTTLRIKSVGSGLGVGQYVRIGNLTVFG